ncbi:hypothetical protein N7G274_010544 [Stereocaulon virgatum]|uniref:Uncharacterized protein n=1 Tax=Stereocaulon virgatum TaxID=373712 RepID=A0ABR3ZTF2_9LECA
MTVNQYLLRQQCLSTSFNMGEHHEPAASRHVTDTGRMLTDHQQAIGRTPASNLWIEARTHKRNVKPARYELQSISALFQRGIKSRVATKLDQNLSQLGQGSDPRVGSFKYQTFLQHTTNSWVVTAKNACPHSQFDFLGFKSSGMACYLPKHAFQIFSRPISFPACRLSQGT